jgi:PleD family two-component response regulator
MKRIALNPEGDGSQQQTQQQQQQQEDETSAERRMSWNPADIHILVVDDETVTRLVLEQLLKKCGYQGACVSTHVCV